MRFVIFDIDGTLTDTKEVDDKCFMKAFEDSFNIDIWSQKWETLKEVTDWSITEEIVLSEWNRLPTNSEYESMISNFMSNLREEKAKDQSQFNEIPGAKDFFYRLEKSKQFKVGIATGGWEESALLKLKAIGIAINNVAFSNSSHHKSRAAILKNVIAQLSRKTQSIPKRIIYFGDGEWDYKPCQNLRACWEI
ncbi:MAG: HAD family hydrolase [Bacteroidota bacterium]